MSRDDKKICTYCGHEGHRASHCPRRLLPWLQSKATADPQPQPTDRKTVKGDRNAYR